LKAGLAATIDAVVPDSSTTSAGFVNGALGFTFTPTANLSVTEVGFFDNSTYANPLVSFWSDTGSVLTSHTFAAGTSSRLMVYDSFSFNLNAGVQYSFVLQDGALSSGNTVLGEVFSHGGGFGIGDFTVASELADYAYQAFDSTGALLDENADAYVKGPNFRYVVVPEPTSMVLISLAIVGFGLMRNRPAKR